MDKEIVLIILLIQYLKISKRHIADSYIEEAVGQCGVLVTLNCNGVFLIQLLRNASRYAVKLNTVNLAAAKTIGHHALKIADTHRRIQDIPGL